MSETPQSPTPTAPKPPTANKRTSTQKAADMLFIERHALRGKTLRQIAELLAKERPYTISHAQVGADLKKLKEAWRQESLAMVGAEKEKELRKLDVVESEAWDAWDKSKQATSRTTLTKKAAAAKKGEGAAASDGGGTETKSAVQTTSAGDPAFIAKILDVHDRRVKLLGLAAPTKTELTGADGGPLVTANIALNDEDQDAILRRHYERMIEDEQAEKQNDKDRPAEATSTPDPT